MTSPAMIQWPLNPEQNPNGPMLPQRPVGLPQGGLYRQPTMGYAQPTVAAMQQQAPPPMPSNGPFQNQAMSLLGGAVGPTGARPQLFMGVPGSGSGVGGGSNDNASTGESPMNPTQHFAEGGNAFRTNESWLNDSLSSAPWAANPGALGVNPGSFGSIAGAAGQGLLAAMSPSAAAAKLIASLAGKLKGDGEEGEEAQAEAEAHPTPQIGGNPWYGQFGGLPPAGVEELLERINPSFEGR